MAAGEKLLLRENVKSLGMKNGEIVTVQRVEPNGTVRLADGRSLPAGYRSFTHGYAITSHASQGRTVDRGILLMSKEGVAAANLQQAYVSNSRFRESQAIYVTDFQSTVQAIETSATRHLASEIILNDPKPIAATDTRNKVKVGI